MAVVREARAREGLPIARRTVGFRSRERVIVSAGEDRMGDRFAGHGSARRACRGILALTGAFSALLAALSAAAAPRAPSAGSDWWAEARARISADEYHVALAAGTTRWTAPCRAQSLRATWSNGTFSLAPRVDASRWDVHLTTTGIARDGRIFGVAPAPVAAVLGNTLTFDHAWGREVYENRPDGIEQTFLVSQAPEGQGPLTVLLELSGATASVSPSGQDAVLRRGGADVVRVSRLAVHANGERTCHTLSATRPSRSWMPT